MTGSRYVRFSAIVSGFALVAMLTTAVSAEEPDQKDLSARQILDRVAKAYATCETYRDSGEVSITFIEVTGDRVDVRPFTTAFVRPHRFRYEYQAKHAGEVISRYLIWRNRDEIKSWWDITPGVKKPESLALALGAAVGGSGGSSNTVPALLMPKDVGGFRLTDLPLFKRLDDGKLDETDCFRLEGVFGKSPRTLWIDKKTSLILRILERTVFEGFSTIQVTTYKPVVGEKVAEDALAFDPPKSID